MQLPRLNPRASRDRGVIAIMSNQHEKQTELISLRKYRIFFTSDGQNDNFRTPGDIRLLFYRVSRSACRVHSDSFH